mmetsp:Transcript_58787/g.140125  ORF Transcript_58787/g.140125 Transcript_58787/m.140125 type:complete len:338 (+) Transcript_58787:96-1109(+)
MFEGGGYGAAGPDFVQSGFAGQAYDPSYPYKSRTVYGVPTTHEMEKQTLFMPGQKRRLNSLAICLALLLPWLLFCAVFALQSFELHYKRFELCMVLTFLLLLPALFYLRLGLKEVVKKVGNEYRVGSWCIFMAITMIGAWVAGFLLGQYNYVNNTRPLYSINDLNTYTEVDPNRLRGMMMQDAGRVEFVEHALPVKNLSMGFVNGDIWCVAPFVYPGTPTPRTYDFWAVGKNCCSGQQSDYHCGHYGNPYAHGGLRLLADSERANYRLAVQQAEAVHSIRATHPLFFIQHQDTAHLLEQMRTAGFRFYGLWMAGAFVLQFFLVTACSVAFAKLGRLP